MHQSSPFYKVDHFRAGGTSLTEVDLAEVGPVAGKSLLHVQCHFGMDTLSWARLGERVTGVDFSPVAIEEANRLAGECGIEATFVCADLRPPLDLGQYDIVYTSFGVLSWLPDLRAWADVVAHHLAPGGAFHIIELHPVLGMFDDDGRKLSFPYFSDTNPINSEETATYAGHEHEPLECYQWSHSMADIINSLLAGGCGYRISTSFRIVRISATSSWLRASPDGT